MLKKILLLLLLVIPLTSAIDQNYNIIIEDNGNSLIIIEFDGKGMINVPIQEDVNEVKVKGALYKLNNNSIDVSIGSTQKAILLYKTSFLTKKEQDLWTFELNTLENSNVTIAMPKNTIIKQTLPEAFIQTSNYTKIMFKNTNKIKLIYEFKEEILQEDVEEETIIKKNQKNYSMFFIIGTVIVLIMSILLLKNKKSNKENIIKTLSKNERIVVNTIIENKGEIKRNNLERKTKLAKSSLANTLNILERKKIIEIDKTYTTHFVKFTRWFNEL